MLKIRLSRIGARQRPFYRVVVMDERSKRSGAYIELLGTYNPLTHPHEIKLKQERIDHWIKQGAQMSDGFLRIIGKAPQRPPRKSKKDKGESGKGKAESNQQEDKTEEKPTEKTQPTAETESKSAEATPETVIPSASEESVANATQSESEDSSPAEPVQNDTGKIATPDVHRDRNDTKEIENERPS